MKKRFIYGLLMGGMFIGLIALDAALSPDLGWMLVLPGVLLCALMAMEIADIGDGGDHTLVCMVSAGLGFIGQCGHMVDPERSAAVAGVCAAIAVAFAMSLHGLGRDTRGSRGVLSACALAHVYPGICLGMLLAVRPDVGAWGVFAIAALAKVSDIAAMLTGMAVGRTKLAAWLSPGKTWEGFFGGLALGAVAGALLPMATDRVGVGLGIVIGVSISLAGQLGDLLASMLKRDGGRKDSGSVAPGFGGLLDVLDSVLAAGPVAAIWVLALS